MEKYQAAATISQYKTREHGATYVGVTDYIINPSLHQAFFAGVAGFGFFLSVVLCIAWYSNQANFVLLVYAAIAFGGFCFGLAGGYRLRVQVDSFYDVTKIVETDETETTQQAQPLQQAERTIPTQNGANTLVMERPAKIVTYNKESYTWAGVQLIQLADALDIRPDVVRDNTGVSGAMWGKVQVIMKGLGYWDDKNHWTDVGVGWLEKV